MQTKIAVGKLFLIRKASFANMLLIKKADIAFALTLIGMLIAFFGSATVWFMWPLGNFYTIATLPLFILSWAISVNLKDKIYEWNKRQIATLVFFLFQLYVILVNGKNFNAVTMAFFDTSVIMVLMALNNEYRQLLGKRISQFLGFILLFSIPLFFLYIVGVPLPNFAMESPNGIYSLSNYVFFVTDSYSLDLFPRFRCIFNEPGHIGTACSLLLFTQIGHWRKWYNILMIVALLMSFSLAAYVLFVMVLIGKMWIFRKKIVLKLTVVAGLLASVVVGSYFYNDGDNMLNQLIVARMEINDDGNLAGDNRVTDSFKAGYEDFLKSDDVLTGRDYSVEKYGFGNSGYRVFIFDNGLLGALMYLLFYLSLTLGAKDKRAAIVMLAVAAAVFWERATGMVFYNIVPLFIAVYPSFDKRGKSHSLIETEHK